MKYFVLMSVLFLTSCGEKKSNSGIEQKMEILGIEKTNELFRYQDNRIKKEIPHTYEKFQERLKLIGEFKNKLKEGHTISQKETDAFTALFDDVANFMGFPNNYFYLLETNEDNATNQYKYFMLIENYIYQLLNDDLSYSKIRVDGLEPFVFPDKKIYKMGETVNIMVGLKAFFLENPLIIEVNGNEIPLGEDSEIHLKAEGRGTRHLQGILKYNLVDETEVPFEVTFEVE